MWRLGCWRMWRYAARPALHSASVSAKCIVTLFTHALSAPLIGWMTRLLAVQADAANALNSFDYPPVAAVTLAYPLTAFRDERFDASGKIPGFGQLHPRSQVRCLVMCICWAVSAAFHEGHLGLSGLRRMWRTWHSGRDDAGHHLQLIPLPGALPRGAAASAELHRRGHKSRHC